LSRIVCDSNCLISGLLWKDGPPGQILERVEDNRDRLFVINEILEEISQVIQRPKFKRALAKSSITPVEIIEWICHHALLVEASMLEKCIVADDPDDDMVLACAETVRPDVIINGDRHLLDIRLFKGIPILSSRQYLDACLENKQDLRSL